MMKTPLRAFSCVKEGKGSVVDVITRLCFFFWRVKRLCKEEEGRERRRRRRRSRKKKKGRRSRHISLAWGKKNGSNLSSGQRQLLCMARALLRRPKVLVLDEATAAVDGAADAAVGRVLRGPEFASSTVLTIAHRLHSIAGADKVLVLEKGEVKEYDSPRALLRREGSAFRGMVLRAAESTKSSRKNPATASSSSSSSSSNGTATAPSSSEEEDGIAAAAARALSPLF